MAAPLNWNAKSITVGGATIYQKVSIVIRQNTATVRDSKTRSLLEQKVGVVSNVMPAGAANLRDVTFDDGSVWQVSRAKGCNCG